jgi:arylsulfatase A-like enzyme
MVAACFFWPGSEAAIKEVRPTFWNKYDGSVPNATRVKTVLDWLRLPDERRPHLITLYFSDIDSASHNNPLDSEAIFAATKAVDDALGVLLDGLDALPLRDRIFLLLTSDHGMAETTKDRVIALSSLIDTPGIRPGFSGPTTSLHVEGGIEGATRVRDQLNERLQQRGVAYLRKDLPERYQVRNNPRFGDVVVVMNEGWFLAATVLTRALIQSRWGEHGWDNALPSMQALFLISGPGIPAGGVSPPVENVDVYPLMTELLGLQAAKDIDGRAGRLLTALKNAPRR